MRLAATLRVLLSLAVTSAASTTGCGVAAARRSVVNGSLVVSRVAIAGGQPGCWAARKLVVGSAAALA